MNIAFFLTPKQDVVTLYDDNTFRKGLEIIRSGKYQVVPVTTRENIYVGVVSLSDFFEYMFEEINENGDVDTNNVDGVEVKDIMVKTSHPAVSVTSTLEEMLDRILQQNFVPVVDDRGAFIGIVTRHTVMEYLKSKGQQTNLE